MGKSKTNYKKILSKVVRQIQPEMKDYINSTSATLSSVTYGGSNQFQSIGALIGSGTSVFTRIGNEILVHKIECRLHNGGYSASVTDNRDQSSVIKWVGGIGGVPLVAADLASGTGKVTQLENPNKVVVKKMHVFNAQNLNSSYDGTKPQTVNFSIKFPKGRKMVYNATSGDPVSGNLWLACRPAYTTIVTSPFIDTDFIIYYTDV